jgi:hypothetical protein
MSKHRDPRKNQPVPLLQMFLQDVGSSSLVVGSVWHPLLEENLSASERERLKSALDSAGVVIADHLVRVMSQEIGTQVTANVRPYLAA